MCCKHQAPGWFPVYLVVWLLTNLVHPVCGQSDSAVELFARARRAAAGNQSEQAIKLASQAHELDPELADALYIRGREQFKLGKFSQSVDDFDNYIRQRPDQAARLWERGIACYYAGRFREGVLQFSAYQGFDDSDVENAVWHLLCLCRTEDLRAARGQMLRVRNDRRLPMNSIYQMYRGSRTPASVLAEVSAADVTESQRQSGYFYANLYIGLLYEVSGDADKSREHITAAANDYRIDHYMGDVAWIHAQRWSQDPHSSSPAHPSIR